MTQCRYIQSYKISYVESSAPCVLSPEYVTTSKQSALIFKDIYASEECIPMVKEYCYVLLLNNANRPLGYVKISEGGTDGTVIDNKLIIKAALDVCATGIILCHNHPSNDSHPGKADLNRTETLHKACELMDIRLLDHIILAQDEYYSFSEEKTFELQ